MSDPVRVRPTLRQLLREIRDDVPSDRGDRSRPGFHAIVIHRIGVWARRQRGATRRVADGLYRLCYVLVRNVYGIEVPRSVFVGRDVRFAHQGGIVVHGGSSIGDGCLIRQNVTIGATGTSSGAPKIGSDVEIGAGAVIIGAITVGDRAKIGPNAVVMKDVPAGASAFAPPARVLQLGTEE